MAVLTGMFAVGLIGPATVFAADAYTTTNFAGLKANSGMAAHLRQGSNDSLIWCDDYKIPDTPAPHWQVVDSKGNVFLLQRRPPELPAFARRNGA